MSAPPPPRGSSPAPPAALSAFLRGIERRAFVFASLQGGDPERAERALGHAMRAFRQLSAATPLSAWPAAFWTLLLAQAELSDPGPRGPDLAALGSGPRAALLLRLVAGLDFGHAAQVLGVSEPTFRYASERALLQLAEAGIRYTDLAELRERLHRQVKTLPPERIAALEALRERILADRPEPVPVAPPPPSPWPRRLLWGALAALALAFAATFLPRAEPPLAPGSSQPLPAEPVAARAPLTDADLVTHPDFELLAAPADMAIAADLALLSWWLGTPDGTVPVPAADAAPAPAPVAPPTPAPATALGFEQLPGPSQAALAPLRAAWPGLDDATRARLLGNLRAWQALPAARRQDLRQRLLAWDAQPPVERARRRAQAAALQSLSTPERDQLRAAAARLAALPAPAQLAVRSQFAELPEDQRQDWWLGPQAGAGFAELRPLLGFVPEDERAALIDLLRSLSAPARADLAQLARRLPADQRDALRRELIAAPAAEREALLRQRLAQ